MIKVNHQLCRGGPAKCPAPCSVCDEDHHWIPHEACDDEDDRAHPAALAGLPCWYDCKHCDAWVEDYDEDADE